MKLRVKGDSLRLRLLRSEVEQLGRSGRVEETVNFSFAPQVKLIYALETSVDVKQIEASFENNRIAVRVPFELARTWIESEQVGISNDNPVYDAAQPDAHKLRLLIEKDFVCLDAGSSSGGDDEDAATAADAYPNPNLRC